MLAEIQAGGNARLDASEDLSLTGVKARAGENLTLQADGDITIASVQNQESRDLKLDIKTSGFLGTETNIRRQQSSTETEGSSLTAGDGVSIRSEAGDVTVQASRIESGGATEIIAEEGKVALLTDTDQSFSQDFKREEDLFWWNERDQGRVEETIRNVEIEAGGGLTIDAGNGVVIKYKATGGDLAASLDQLSASPGLSWVNDLRNDPALAGKVDWQAVNAEFREWDYKSQGLTEAGAALVTLVATALTAGTGVTAAMSASLTTSLSGGAAMNAALNAGLQTLINKTAVSLVNNQGDLGATLKELGSTDTLRSLATAMVTAGMTTQLLQSAGLGIDLPDTAPFADRLVQRIQQGLIRATVRAGVTTAIEGGKLDDALVAALRLEAASILGEHAAETIGAAYHGGDIGKLPQLIAHAALGCATGALASGDCGAGAAGAFAGELAAKLQIQNWTENKLEQYASLQGKPLSAAEAKALQASLQAEFLSFKQQGVDIARLAGGLAAALTGGDVYTGADAGGNAAANNSWTAAGAAGGCAVGAPAGGVGCLPGAAAGATAGAAVDVAVIILGVAGLIILNQTAEDAQAGIGHNGGPPLDDETNGNNGSPDPNGDKPKVPPQVAGLDIDYDKISTAKPDQPTAPRNLQEQVLWNQVIRDPAAGERLRDMNNDPRFPTSNGWQKMQVSHRTPDGRSITIHYQYNSVTGKAYDIKLTK